MCAITARRAPHQHLRGRGSGGLNGPVGLAFGLDGHLYVASFRPTRSFATTSPRGALIGTSSSRRAAAGSTAPPILLGNPVKVVERRRERLHDDPGRRQCAARHGPAHHQGEGGHLPRGRDDLAEERDRAPRVAAHRADGRPGRPARDRSSSSPRRAGTRSRSRSRGSSPSRAYADRRHEGSHLHPRRRLRQPRRDARRQPPAPQRQRLGQRRHLHRPRQPAHLGVQQSHPRQRAQRRPDRMRRRERPEVLRQQHDRAERVQRRLRRRPAEGRDLPREQPHRRQRQGRRHDGRPLRAAPRVHGAGHRPRDARPRDPANNMFY